MNDTFDVRMPWCTDDNATLCQSDLKFLVSFSSVTPR